jgi:hypothetical protein
MSDADAKARQLLVVGAGHLGGRVVSLWRSQFPAAQIISETRSIARHQELRDAGSTTTRTRSEDLPRPASHLLISLPPSQVEDYGAEIDRAVSLWSRTARLVMVSSTAVYAEENGGICTEDSALGSTPRAQCLLDAERRVWQAGGIVVRMAGLYHRHRGPHIVYLRTKRSNRRPDGIINLIHYDDAAALCLAALIRGQGRSFYVGCDDQPVSRQELVDATIDSGLYGHRSEIHRTEFAGTNGPLGRRCSNARTRKALDWRPRYGSYMHWLRDAGSGLSAIMKGRPGAR